MWREISRALDSYAGQWTPLREGACRSGEKLAQKCLDDRFTALDRLVKKLDGLNPAVADLESGFGGLAVTPGGALGG